MQDQVAAGSPTGTQVLTVEVYAGVEPAPGIAAGVFPDAAALLTLERELLGGTPVAADRPPRQNIFRSHLSALAKHTQGCYATALHRFTDFLAAGCASLTLSLAEEPRLWGKISSGLVEAFKQWLQQEGYCTSTINNYLGIIKAHASLAHQAGMLVDDAMAAIQSVKRIEEQRGGRMDQEGPRDSKHLANKGPQEAEPLSFEGGQRGLLTLLCTSLDDSPQGRRDLVVLLLLFELGISPDEAAALRFSDLDLVHRRMRVQCKTAGASQYLELTDALHVAISSYLECRRDWSRYAEKRSKKTNAPLLVQSRKTNQLFEKHDLEEAREAEKRERERTGRRRRKRNLPKSASWSAHHLSERVHALVLQAGLPPLASYDEKHAPSPFPGVLSQ